MELCDFSDGFEAIHGVAPFPWQARLAAAVCQTGRWPELIGVPTGCGKTATLDVALFHLAWCAHHNLRERMRRRVVFVVNRRVIVDEAYDRAARLQRALRDAKDRTDALGRWARALASLGGDEPVKAWRLRGGVPRERGFARDPVQPIILAATVDQIGSRVLFRGYGLSEYSQPLHAGLLGVDTLVLADEAHLAEPFLDTLRMVASRQSRASVRDHLPPPVAVVQLTATGRDASVAFGLNTDDHSHPAVRQRIKASKSIKLIRLSRREPLADRLAQEALALSKALQGTERTPAVAVVVNRVATAREVFERVHREFNDDQSVALFIGRSRPFDRERLMATWAPRLKSGRPKEVEQKPVIVVATQTIEVGADFDFHGMITELASWDSLRQRFGRLNRLGAFPTASGVIVAPAEIPEEDPIYAATLEPTWQFLVAQSGQSAAIDLSIANLAGLQERAPAEAIASATRGPLLAHSLIDLFAQTSPRPRPDPEVAPFLHGFKRGEPEIQVVFRAGLPLDEQNRLVTDPPTQHRVQQLLDALPPSSGEALALPRSAFIRWVSDLNATDSGPHELTDMEGGGRNEDTTRAGARAVWSWQGDTLQDIRPEQAESRGVLVVPCEWGGCDGYGFAPASRQPVEDLAELAAADRRHSAVLMVERLAYLPWIRPPAGGDAASLISQLADQLRLDLRALAESGGDPLLMMQSRLADEKFRACFDPQVASWLRSDPKLTVELLLDADDTPFAFHLRYGRPASEDLSDEGLAASRSVPVTLKDHSLGVERWARKFVDHTPLTGSAIGADISLAARLHDLGKAEPRFQRMLGGPTDASAESLLAKSDRRTVRHEELGARHECYSVSLVTQNLELVSGAADQELVLHLIGAHHGRGRALMPATADLGRDFELVFDGMRLRHRGAPALGDVGSGWAERYWNLVERFGPWGLAYFEALLRLADHRRSAEEIEKAKNV